MNWDYLQPVKIRFGKGRVSEVKDLAKEMGIKNGLLVADPFFFTNGLAERIVKESEGAIIASFGDLSPNPDVTEVDACAAIIREKEIGFVVALGGGSSMDCAKAAASIALTDDSIRKYHGTGVAMPQEHLPLIAVPTTAGTGSEVTCVSVLTDHANGKKSPIVSDGFFPSYAIIDPELTYTMPPKVTAGTGIDVLSHALEGFWSKGHQPICDACALHAAELVFQYLYKAYLDPADDTEEMADAIHELKAKMGLRNDLKDLHLTEEQISELVRISRHPNLYNNPVEITDEMLSEMYHKLA